VDIKKTIENDLNTLAAEFLHSLEYKIDINKGGFDQLLKLKHWIIEDRVRNVSFAQNFCVPQKYEEGLEILLNKIKKGCGDIFRYQSRGLFNGNAKDSMFYDFGIHHLHLGITTDLKHKKMIEGTKDVAFVYINNEEVFFISLMEHGEWHLQNNLRILHKERPDLIQHRKVIGINGDDLTDEEILRCRKLGVNYLINIDGVTYKSESIVNFNGIAETVIFSHRLHSTIENIVVEQLDNFQKEFNIIESTRIDMILIDIDFNSFNNFKFKLNYNDNSIIYHVDISELKN
jgi:hypothetical protein